MTAVATGPTPAWSRGPGTKVKLLPYLHVDQDGNVVGSLVGDDQVGPAVAVESATVMPTGLVPVKKP